jgi:putative membrane protein
LHPALAVHWLLVLQPVVIALVYRVCGWEPIYRYLIPPQAAERAVAHRAFAIFAERGVHRTRDRSGLLVLVSELEHRVVILGDSGIHERVHEDGWAAQVSHLVARIREGKTKQGLIEVIESFAPTLAEIAPRRPDDTNELPDSVVRA